MMGVIPAAGRGKRMHPLTEGMPKAALPVLNKPIAGYVVDAMRAAGIEDICIVVKYMAEEVIEALGRGRLTFCYQEGRGNAMAIKQLEEYIDEDFLVIWGDNFFQGSLEELISSHNARKADISLIVERKAGEGVCTLKDGRIVKIEDKPLGKKIQASVAGVFILSPRIFELIDMLPKSPTGEYELADALQLAIDMGFRVNHVWLKGWRMNITTPGDLLNVNLRMLRLRGLPYHLGDGTSFEGSRIRNSVIGEHVKLEKCTVKNSLVLDGARIHESVLKHCIVQRGREVLRQRAAGSLESPCII